MYNTIIEFLKKEKWQYSEIAEKDAIFFGVSGKHGNFQCIANINNEESKFTFYSICGSNAPAEKRKNVLEFINDLNNNLDVGNFQIDLEDGEVRFKTGIFFHSLDINVQLIENIILPNLIGIDTALPGIVGLMFGDLTVPQALDAVYKESENLNSEPNNIS